MMAKIETLTLSSVTGLLSPSAAYMLGYGWLLGMSLWVTFFGGVIAFKALPRQQFGALQHRTFPVYFVLSMALSLSLLALWTYFHSDVVPHIWRPNVTNVAQAYALASVFACQALNYFVVGPFTSKTMFKRYALEKEEGKSHSDSEASAQMKALNRRFGVLHGVSSLANLWAVVALIFHGLWIGNAGIV